MIMLPLVAFLATPAAALPTTSSDPIELGLAISKAWGYTPAVARINAEAAIIAATPDLDPLWLIAVARKESDLTMTSVSVVGKSRFCGPLQSAAGSSMKKCRAQQDPMVGYQVGADELREWLGKTHGNLDVALQGHACGNIGLKGACKAYPRSVYGNLGQLRYALDVLRQPRPIVRAS